MPSGHSNSRARSQQLRKDEADKVELALENATGDELSSRRRAWRPISLRTPFLVAIAVVTFGLVALLQTLLSRSQRDDGLLFASNIGSLPIYQSSLYLYLPTAISVIYSLLWSWIDLDTKRVEPFRQLSKPGGAKAEDSLLLDYPFDFLATVPWKSLRRRHWPVFIGSTALVLVSWAIVPLQGAIFATDTVTKVSVEPMLRSTRYLTTAQQTGQVTSNYTYSVYSIAWLQERLPPYMSRDAVLAPFQLGRPAEQQDDETWAGMTTLYSVDVTCEPAMLKSEKMTSSYGASDVLFYTSSHGCKVTYPYGPTGDDTVDETGQGVQEYSALYAGYENHDGLASYYMSLYCPANASNVFMAIFAQNKRHANDSAKAPTILFCEPTYYQQNFTAIIRQQDRSIFNTTALGSKQSLPPDLYNPLRLEWQMNSATEQQPVRGDIPSSRWPDQKEQMASLPITMQWVDLSMMTGLAIGAYQRPLEEYLDPAVLQQSYEAAYRLLFARYMVDVLEADFDGAETTSGTRSYATQAMYMVPGFTYAVEGLLITVGALALALLLVQCRQPISLTQDPSSIAALMALAACDPALLKLFTTAKPDDEDDVKATLRGKLFHLERVDNKCGLRLLPSSGGVVSANTAAGATDSRGSITPKTATSWEFSAWTGAGLTMVLLIFVTVLTYLYLAGRQYGLALPTSNRFVRQLLENYVPIVIATLIEPVWVMLNRFMCLMQPYEDMRKGSRTAQRPITISYLTLPPQLVIAKASFHRHFNLSAVCLMALLANVLAVAFGAMFNENVVVVPVAANVSQQYEPHLKDIDGTIGPWNNSALNGAGLDQLYIAMSNLTSATPMPAWTDNGRFYVPLGLPDGANDTDQYKANSTAFGANVTCLALRQGTANAWTLALSPDYTVANLTVALCGDEFGSMNCSGLSMSISGDGDSACSSTKMAAEIVTTVTGSGGTCVGEDERWRQLIIAAWLRKPSSDICHPSGPGPASGYSSNLTDDEATVIACLPKLLVSSADVTVESSGTVQSIDGLADHATNDLQQYFTGDSSSLISQANNFLIGARTTPGFGGGGVWHNDSFPSDWNNYIMEHIGNDSSFLDPVAAPPAPDVVVPLFGAMYSKLFAVWFGMKHEAFLEPAGPTKVTIGGSVLQKQTRIVVSRAMFILADSILGLYVVTILVLFLRRPGRGLPRPPTTIASTIALFAASRATDEVGMIAHLSDKDGRMRLGERCLRLGLGAFSGGDERLYKGNEGRSLLTKAESDQANQGKLEGLLLAVIDTLRRWCLRY